ncbi:AsmA family protein [Zymobacter palmae]|uniref:AsmA domain-containing protein n=1 Tax=Zymobacter palmae TaxID=33074 RepID=A0A348HIA4_9GAMM|nr:AsmA family protein [Zymobacter palmae]BBG31356.1 uncharacterized protein ZBT109_2629 [Zymobacter palmae]
MKVVCRGILLVIALAVVMVVAAVIYALAFFDPNDLKPRIVDAVREKTGLTLVMDGNISWRFYPHIGFSIDSVKAYAPDQLIMNGPQASIRHADISLSMSRLLMGDVIVDGLNAQGVRVNLLCDERRQQSCLTWLSGFKDVLATSMPVPPRPFLVEAPHRMGDGAAAFPQRAEGGNEMGMRGMPPPREMNEQNARPSSWPRLIFDLHRIKIEDGEVHYQGREDGLVQRLDINQMTLVGTQVALGRHFPISVTFDVASGTRLPPATVTAQAEVCSNVLMGRHEIEHLRLAALSGNKRYSLSMGQLAADTDHQEYRIRDVRIDGMLRSLFNDDSESPFSLAFDGRYDGLTDKAQIENIDFGHQGVDVQGSVEGLTLLSSPRWKGTLALATNNLRQWLSANAVTGLPEDTRAFRQLTADIDFNVDDRHLAVDSIKGRLDGQPLNASVQWDYGDAPAFELEMPSLSLDRYLPPESGLWSLVGGNGVRDMVAPAWVNWLRQHRSLMFKARADIDELMWNDRTLHNLSLALSTQDGRWQLSRLAAMVGDGQVMATGGAQVDQAPGRLYFNASFKDVPLYAERVADVDKPDPTLSGRMELAAQLNDPWGTLSGPVSLALRNDDQSGAWLSHTVCRAVAQASNIPTGEVVPALMEAANGRFTLRDGILYSDDLRGRLSGNSVEGEGIFDLARHRFDYHVLVRSTTTALAGCTLPREMSSNGVPLRCSGTLADMADSWCGLDDERSSGILRNSLRHNDRWSTSP